MQCARHPDARADGTCERCGDFVCRACQHPGHPALCARCGDRLPRGIAWEDPRYGVLPWRFVLTLRDVLLRPKVAFPGPARAWPGVLFAAAACAVSLVPLLALNLDLAGTLERAGAVTLVSGTVLVAALLTVTLVVTQALTFGVGLMMVGRRHGVMRFGLRAASYASALGWVAFFAVVGVHELIAWLDAGWVVLLLVWVIPTGRVFVSAARGLGLTTSKAVTAAVGPTLLCTAPVAMLAYERLGGLAG